MTLQTKIQYKNYEPGEFTGNKERTCEETIQLIENFPWDEQRDHLAVGPTSPSVTIEGVDGNFLKLAPYYGGKFVLYYLDDRNNLYTRHHDRYQDAYPSIKSFFASSLFDPADFKLEHFWLQGKTVHFKDQDFHYTVSNRSTLVYLLPLSFGVAFPTIILLKLIFSNMDEGLKIRIIIVILFLLAIMGFLLWLFLKHYHSVKDKLLILSRGSDLFYYGDKQDPGIFYKKDIEDVIVYGGRQYGNTRRNSLNWVEINFKDGRSINFSSLLLDDDRLRAKLAGYTYQQIFKLFPFIPPSASAPF